MNRKFICLIASMLFLLIAGTSGAYSQSSYSLHDLAEVITNESADIQDAQALQADESNSKGTIMPGPAMKMPLPMAPPPAAGYTGYYGFFSNADSIPVTFSVSDSLNRELSIKLNDTTFINKQPNVPGFIYSINVGGNETKVFLIGLKQYGPGATHPNLIITGNGGEYYLLKVKN